MSEHNTTSDLNLRPKQCCPIGSIDCQVPMPINGRVEYVDLCVAPVLARLNAAGVTTAASCCGHGELPGRITLDDGTELWLGEDLERLPLAVGMVHMSRGGSDESVVEVDKCWHDAVMRACGGKP